MFFYIVLAFVMYLVYKRESAYNRWVKHWSKSSTTDDEESQ